MDENRVARTLRPGATSSGDGVASGPGGARDRPTRAAPPWTIAGGASVGFAGDGSTRGGGRSSRGERRPGSRREGTPWLALGLGAVVGFVAAALVESRGEFQTLGRGRRRKGWRA